MMHAAKIIFLNALPIVLMIGLIPLVRDDVTLSALYILIIAAALLVKREPYDLTVFAFGFAVLLISEYFFVSTGVETFNRHTLLGVMPLWLPILWGYGFIAIRRGVTVLTIGS